MKAIWGHIWKITAEKNQTNVTNVTLHPLMQVHYGHIWKYTVEKGPTNATNVTLRPLRQAIWRDIWKRTVKKNQTNAKHLKLELSLQQNRMPLALVKIWPTCNAISIGSNFGHHMAIFALVTNLATRWHHLHYLQIWPTDGAIYISCKFGLQMAPLA